MTKIIFVSATGTNVGKTYTCLRLMETIAANGMRVMPFKPIETGVDGEPSDATALLGKYKELYGDDESIIDDFCMYKLQLPAAPYVADKKRTIEITKIKEYIKTLSQKADVVLIEGAGGLFVPIAENYFMIDLARECADFTVLVSHTGLGCINDALLSKKALDNFDIKHRLVFNRRQDDEFDIISKPFLTEHLGDVYELENLDKILI